MVIRDSQAALVDKIQTLQLGLQSIDQGVARVYTVSEVRIRCRSHQYWTAKGSRPCQTSVHRRLQPAQIPSLEERAMEKEACRTSGRRQYSRRSRFVWSSELSLVAM